MKWSKEVLENINFENITNREEKEKISNTDSAKS